MPEIDLFPVVCTAKVPTSVVEKLLREAHAASERLVPGSEPRLALITTTTTTTTTDTTTAALPTRASHPPLQPSTSPFLNAPLSAIPSRLPSVRFLAVLDARSAADARTALVVAARETDDRDGVPKSVRVTLDAVQRLLTSLDVGTTGIDEVRGIAEARGGVYGAAAEGAQKGGPAPAKRLGA